MWHITNCGAAFASYGTAGNMIFAGGVHRAPRLILHEVSLRMPGVSELLTANWTILFREIHLILVSILTVTVVHSKKAGSYDTSAMGESLCRVSSRWWIMLSLPVFFKWLSHIVLRGRYEPRLSPGILPG